MNKIKKYAMVIIVLSMGFCMTACTQTSRITMGVGESYTSSEAKKYKSTAKYTTSKKSVATVSKKGKVTAKKVGKATITGTKSSNKYICKVTVKKAVKKVNVDAVNITLRPYQTYRPEVTFSPKNAATFKLTYTSSNENVAIVSETGLIQAIGIGETTITIKTANKKKAVITVTVSDNMELQL